MCLLSSLDQRQLLRKRKMILIYSIYICKKWNSLWLCVCSMSFILINKSHFLHNLCFECINVTKIHFKQFQFRSFSESNCLYIHILPKVNPNVLRIRSETFTKQKVWWFPLKLWSNTDFDLESLFHCFALISTYIRTGKYTFKFVVSQYCVAWCCVVLNI